MRTKMSVESLFYVSTTRCRLDTFACQFECGAYREHRRNPDNYRDDMTAVQFPFAHFPISDFFRSLPLQGGETEKYGEQKLHSKLLGQKKNNKQAAKELNRQRLRELNQLADKLRREDNMED